MSRDDDLRIGRWVPGADGGYGDGDEPDTVPILDGGDVFGAAGGPRRSPDDGTEPWARVAVPAGEAETREEPETDPDHGGWRLTGRRPAPRRIAVGVVMVAVVAAGVVVASTGSLTMPPVPGVGGLPGASSTPTATGGAGSPAGGTSRLGAAPSPTPSSPASSSSPTASVGGTPASPSPVVTSSYEAESAELGGFVRVDSMEGASGGEIVRRIGILTANYVRFTGVTVETSGEHELTIHYASPDDRAASISVNDGPLIDLSFPGVDDGGSIATLSVPVELAAGGENTIWFGKSLERAPRLDRITVTG